MNGTLIERQTEMFDSDLPLWRQWQIACDYLDEDVDSGFVRILNELSAAGWSDPGIGAEVRKAMAGWYALLSGVAARASKRFGGLGPLTPEDVAALVGSAFLGAEMNLLSGHESPEVPVRRALRRFGEVLRQVEESGKPGG